MELFQRYTEKRPKSKSRIKLHYNPLSPNIHIQILQTNLHTFPLRISWENLKGIFS